MSSHERTLVFLGPTLDRTSAGEICNAVYLPPAEQGSIFSGVMEFRPQTIALIDGAFASVPAVRHKEILWAMSQGVEVYGAASMGALRAAELAEFGMQGWGLIYRWYRSTDFADDDEVAVAMGPPELGAFPVGEALINMRLTLRHAERCHIIPRALRIALEAIARRTHFLERSYPNLFAQAMAALTSEWLVFLGPLQDWIVDHTVDQKRSDAIGLLRCLANAAPENRKRRPYQSTHPFIMTAAWANDLESSGLGVKV
ncbi:hypothetical protein J4G37_27560 [Microvirga sp. 3-52]|nr:hypothetical protein [Microvirga sp. 3-52]